MQCSVGHCSAIFVASCIMEKGAEQVAARRAADQEYSRTGNRQLVAFDIRHVECYKLPVASTCCWCGRGFLTKNANFKRRRQESCQRSAADNYEAALIDVISVDTTPNVTIMLPCWRRPVVRPHRRAAAVRSAAAVCYKRIAVDRAGTRYTMCCCFGTAPTAFTWASRDGNAKSVTAMEYYC